LAGHSRTAIFSTYALSARYDFFNGAIASSTSYFDFGDSLQQKQFESFLDGIKDVKHNYYLCFSSGESKYGDPHEPSVNLFREYMHNRKLPANLLWADYKEPVGHMTVPGMTLGRSLVFIFEPYRLALENCMAIVNDSLYADAVPWQKYLAEYEKASTSLGYTMHPDLIFFNSIASSYYNDYFGFFKENSLPFSTEVLQKSIEYYPNDYDLLSWLAMNYAEMKQNEKAIEYRDKAIQVVKNISGLKQFEKDKLIESISESVVLE
jgi:tetratricopeptide (TPR) repeat protein